MRKGCLGSNLRCIATGVGRGVLQEDSMRFWGFIKMDEETANQNRLDVTREQKSGTKPWDVGSKYVVARNSSVGSMVNEWIEEEALSVDGDLDGVSEKSAATNSERLAWTSTVGPVDNNRNRCKLVTISPVLVKVSSSSEDETIALNTLTTLGEQQQNPSIQGINLEAGESLVAIGEQEGGRKM
ncbi:hypothetical protein L195_g047654, partial [Trifolium pratense]